MADATTDAPEKFSASYGCGGRGKRCVSRWNHRAAYELSKVVDVSQAEVIGLIFRVLRGLENGSHVGGAQPVRDSHLVEIGVANKGKQAAVLVLPAEASDAGLSRSLKDRSLHNFAMNPAFAQLRLSLGDCNQSPVVNGFDKSIPQRVEGSAQCADVFCCRDVLLGLRTDRSIINNRSAGNRVLPVVDKDGRVNEIAIFILVPNPEFCELAGSAAVRILMTTDAGSCVVHGPKSGLHGMVLLIDLLIAGKRVSGWLGNSVADALRAAEAGSVEPGRRFGC
jgi:hypothetical protein